MRETARTSLLIAAFGGGCAVLAVEAAGPAAFAPALVLSLGMGVVMMIGAGPLLLRLYRARAADETSAPGVVRLMRELSGRVALPAPRVWIIDDPAPAAFATGLGPRRAAVALTTGLLSLLNERELRAVLAHELAHIQRRDTRAASLCVAIAGVVPMLALAALGLVGLDDAENEGPGAGGLSWLWAGFATLAGLVVLLVLDREREFAADQWAAALCGDAEALASALRRLERAAGRVPRGALRHPQTAALLTLAPGDAQGWRALLAPQPSAEGRIARLRALPTGPQAQV